MKKLNFNEFIWFIILSSFAYLIYGLFASGKINIYIHPKMFKYVYFSFSIFVLLAISQIRRIFTPGRNKIKLGFIVFIVPLLLAFIVNPDSLSTQIISNKGVNIGNTKLDNIKCTTDIEHNENDMHLNCDEHDHDHSHHNEYNDAQGELFKNTLTNLSENLDGMMGKEIELMGFVYRQKDFSHNRFMISRLIMSCCAADTQITGILCEWDEEGKLKDSTWIKVKGIVDKSIYYNKYSKKNESIPLIRVIKGENIEVPEKQYIYN